MATATIDELRKNFKLMNRLLSKNIKKNTKKNALRIRNKARTFTDNPAGNMARAIVSMKVGKGNQYRVVSKKPTGSRWPEGYNVLQEFGIRPNPSYGFVPGKGMVPLFSQGNRINPSLSPHQGAPAKHFMKKAFTWGRKNYRPSMLQTVQQVLKQVFG